MNSNYLDMLPDDVLDMIYKEVYTANMKKVCADINLIHEVDAGKGGTDDWIFSDSAGLYNYRWRSYPALKLGCINEDDDDDGVIQLRQFTNHYRTRNHDPIHSILIYHVARYHSHTIVYDTESDEEVQDNI